MKRLVLLTSILALIMFIPLVIWQEWLDFINQRENLLIAIILSLLEIFGIIIVISLVHQSIQYRRPRRFVFEGFSNASQFADNQKQSIDLNSLAREEIIFQFQIVYHELQKYADNWMSRKNPISSQRLSPSTPQPNSDADVYTPLFTKKDLYFESNANIQSSLPIIGEYRSDISIEIFNILITQLKQVMKSFGDYNDAFAIANIVGGPAPQEIGFFLRFIDAVFPPKVIKATGHLQYRKSLSERVGITLETIDSTTQQFSPSRTIWQPNRASKKSLTESYIELLSPAMRWLVLMFWEQEVEPKLKFDYFGSKSFTHQQLHARFLYLLGSLYRATAKQFPTYSNFFNQLAIEHLRRASNEDKNCWLPVVYQANLCNNEIQKSTKKESKILLLHEALRLYKEALKRTSNEDIIYGENARKRMKLDETVLKLKSGDKTLIDQAKKYLDHVQETEQLETIIFHNDLDRSALYFYSLACCYGIAAKDDNIGIANAKEWSQRYCAYSLARDLTYYQDIERDPDLECINDKDVEKLVEKLKGKQPNLSTKEGEEFTLLIDDILNEIGWNGAVNLRPKANLVMAH
jgi:hypothetical protein